MTARQPRYAVRISQRPFPSRVSLFKSQVKLLRLINASQNAIFPLATDSIFSCLWPTVRSILQRAWQNFSASIGVIPVRACTLVLYIVAGRGKCSSQSASQVEMTQERSFATVRLQSSTILFVCICQDQNTRSSAYAILLSD